MVWPAVFGNPVPTVENRKAPLLELAYSCPPKISRLRLFALVVETTVPGPVPPMGI
jgi:hypothetical protein